jgi:DUF917 family protein
MTTFGVAGVSVGPMALVDERGGGAIIESDDNARAEWYARGLTVRIGGSAHKASYPMSGAEVKRSGIPRTISLGILVGRAIREARERREDPFAALTATLRGTLYGHGRVLFSGKIVDVERRVEGGFTTGRAQIESFELGEAMQLSFQNELLMATVGGEVRAIVPDLICVLDVESAEPITTEHLRYGQRVCVFAISTPAVMRTPEALAVFGPAAFGLDYAWRPLESLA